MAWYSLAYFDWHEYLFVVYFLAELGGSGVITFDLLRLLIFWGTLR